MGGQLSDFIPPWEAAHSDPGDIRYTAGVGARLLLPFGPLRMDLTWSKHPDFHGTVIRHRLFPFDVQRLPLLIAHKNKNANKLCLVVDRGGLGAKDLQDIYPQEWRYIGREDFAGMFTYVSNFGNPSYVPGTPQAHY